MARLRSQSKGAGPASIPEPRRRGRPRASAAAATPIRSDLSEFSTRPRGRGRPPRKSKASEEPPSSQRRQTRSHTDNQAFESLSSPKRKRRRTIGEPDDQPAKRQHSHDAEGAEEEEQTSKNHDEMEDDDDESVPPGQDFFKSINKTILLNAEQTNKLPELRPDDNAEDHSANEGRAGIVVELSQDDNRDAIEAEAEGADDAEVENDAVIEVEAETKDSQADKDVKIVDETPAQVEEQEGPSTSAKPSTSTEQPTEQDGAESMPDPSQQNPSQSGQQKKRRQSRKATFGEPDYQVFRAASPVLGSDPPRSQARRASKPKKPLLSQAQQTASYEFVGDDQDNDQEQPPGREQGQTSTAATQATRKRGGTQSQATRPPAEGRRDVAEDTADDEVQGGSRADDDSEADEEPSELEPEAECESGDVVGSEDELESESDASYIEDSLLIEPPMENEPAVATKIHGKVAQKLVTILSCSGWMGKRKWDRDAKLEGATARRDFKALKKNSKPLARSRLILAHVYGLWKLCHKLPRSPRLDEQNKYFREHKAQFSRLITKTNRLIDQYISAIMKEMGSDHDAPASNINNRRIISKLHRCIIPMLVWLLRDVFIAGCDIKDEKMQNAVNHTGEFTLSTLQLLTRISGWIWRLGEALLNWSDLYPPKPAEKKDDWKKLKPAIKTVRDEIKEAMKRIDEVHRAPERRKKALENDRAVQRERERRQQQEKEIRDQQMQRFIESTQRKSSSQNVSHRPTRETTSSRPARHRPTRTASQSHPAAPRLSQEQEAEYFEKEGWHFWEDDELLKVIRGALHPDYTVLRSACPGRSLTEVKERAKHLRSKIRGKYERIGTEPPLWTYEHE